MNTYLDSNEDIQWLFDVHLKNYSNLVSIGDRPYIALLTGNEDAPETVEIFDKDDYRVAPMARFIQNEEGNLEREFKKITLQEAQNGVSDGDYTLVNGSHGKDFQVRGGTWYHGETHPQVIAVLEDVKKSGKEIRIDLGDSKTGRSWSEENDIVGTIGRSTGWMKSPLMIAENDDGGPDILDHCIVAIMTPKQGKDLYRHPEYSPKYDWSGAKIEMNSNFDAVMSRKESAFKVLVAEIGNESSGNQYVAGFKSLDEAEGWIKDKKKFEKQPNSPKVEENEPGNEGPK